MSLPRIPVRPFATLTDELNAKAVATMWQQKKFLWESDTMPNISGSKGNAEPHRIGIRETFACPHCGSMYDNYSSNGVLTLGKRDGESIGVMIAESCPGCRSLLHILHQAVRDWHHEAVNHGATGADGWMRQMKCKKCDDRLPATGITATICSKCGTPYTHGKPNCICK